MGCGISTLDAEEASLSRRSNRHGRQHTIVPPVTDNNLVNKKDFDNGDNGVGNDVIVVMKPLDDEETKTTTSKEVGSNEEKLKEKCVMDKKEEEEEEEEERVFESRVKEEHGGNDIKHAKNVKSEEEHEENNTDRDDSFIGPGSPSFRDYCIDYDSADRSSVGDFNYDCDSGESTKNGSCDDSINTKNKPKTELSVNSNKEPERKERRGRGFRNVINRGKTRGGKRNLLNFACYNASSESHAEGSLNKIVGKTA